MNLLKEQRSIGLVTILSGLIALICMILTLIAVDFNNDALSDPVVVLTMAGTNAIAVRWSMIADMFGYYLLLLPVIYLFSDWMKDKSAWKNLVTFCGISYVLIGSIGASILAVVWPNIIQAFHVADAMGKEMLKADFRLINDAVYGGLWNLLEMTFASTWWIFAGYQLLKNEFSFMGWLTIITGISCLGDAIAGMLQLDWLHELSLNIYLVLAIVWAIGMGIFLMKRKLK